MVGAFRDVQIRESPGLNGQHTLGMLLFGFRHEIHVCRGMIHTFSFCLYFSLAAQRGFIRHEFFFISCSTPFRSRQRRYRLGGSNAQANQRPLRKTQHALRFDSNGGGREQSVRCGQVAIWAE